MKMAESWCKWMKIDESEWKWIKVDVMQMDVNGSQWKWMKWIQMDDNSNTRSYTRRSVPSSLGRSSLFLYHLFLWIPNSSFQLCRGQDAREGPSRVNWFMVVCNNSAKNRLPLLLTYCHCTFSNRISLLSPMAASCSNAYTSLVTKTEFCKRV